MKAPRSPRLIAVFCAVPTIAMAELAPLAESDMASVTGQAGLTVEVSAELSMKELAYKDAGYLLVRDITLGGMGGATPLDNLRFDIDVAGNGEVLHHGFSRMAQWASQGLVSTSNADVAAAVAKYDQGGNYGKQFNDGDLVIHMDALNPGVLASNSSDQNISAYQTAIDFGLNIGSVELAGSGYTVGSDTTTGAHMFTDMSIQGYLGPTDIIIRNAGDTYTDVANGSMSVSDQKLEIDAFFQVTDMDMDWDSADVLLLFNFAGLKIRDMQIHNRRGADSEGSFGFASVSADISQGINNVNGATGLAVTDIDLRMDMDMPHVQFGSAPSIGEVYFTDFVITSDLLVYGH